MCSWFHAKFELAWMVTRKKSRCWAVERAFDVKMMSETEVADGWKDSGHCHPIR